MRIVRQSESCSNCKSRCDIYFTAMELGLLDDLHRAQVRFRKHETIAAQHDVAEHAIIILEGQAKMYIEGFGGRNLMIGLIVPGNTLGLMAVFGTRHYPYHVKALTDVHCCLVEIAFLKRMYETDQSFRQRLNEAFAHSVNNIMRKLVSLNQKQLRARMAESLLYLAEVYESNRFRLTLTRNDLGELAGITGENAVRVLSEFRKEGIIGLEGRAMELIMPDMLRKISQAG